MNHSFEFNGEISGALRPRRCLIYVADRVYEMGMKWASVVYTDDDHSKISIGVDDRISYETLREWMLELGYKPQETVA